MGLLDKLMFWKKETVELDYEVSGCFTLPTHGAPEDIAAAAGHQIQHAEQVQDAKQAAEHAVDGATEQS